MATKVVCATAWLLSTLCAISAVTTLMTLSDTIANVAGVFAAVLWGIVSVKSHCFIKTTDFINKFKNKKNEK